MHKLSEEAFELDLMEKCKEELGFELFDATSEIVGGDNSTFGRQTTDEVILPKNLRSVLLKLNPDLPQEALDNAYYELTQDLSSKTPIGANRHVYSMVKDGVKVQFKDNDGIDTTDIVKVIDFQEPQNNEYLLIRQFKISGERYNCRADLILFVNGLPLVFIELKASHKHIENAFNDNITHYKKEIPQVFWYNAFIIVSNGTEAKFGTLTSKWEHFSDWKKIDNDGTKGIIPADTLMRGMCEPKNLLDIIENYTLFQETKGGTIKICGKNHQFLGVNSAIERFKTNTDGKLGVFWHTQGSGKSFSMIFFVQKILRKIKGNWTFVVVTDRTDLDEQIYKNFVSTGAVTEQNIQATSQDSINKRIKEIDSMIANGYKRMLKNADGSEDELWNATYKQLSAEKTELRERLACIDKADDEFYKQSDLILNFCKDASNIFIKSTPSQKRTICEIIGSNFKANAQKLDITLYPLFYDIIQINMLNSSKSERFELTETQSGRKKEPSKKALNLNGGNDEARTRDLMRDRHAL